MLISRMEPMLGNSTYWSHCIPESQYRKKLQHQPHVLHFFNIFWCHYLQQKCQRSISASGILVSDKNCIFLKILDSQKRFFFCFKKYSWVVRTFARMKVEVSFARLIPFLGRCCGSGLLKFGQLLGSSNGVDAKHFSNWIAWFYIGMPRIA